MSDSVKKWYEMLDDSNSYNYKDHIKVYQDETLLIYESPDDGKTVTARPFGADVSDRVVIKSPTLVSEGHKKQAYQILIDYPKESILEAARILNTK